MIRIMGAAPVLAGLRAGVVSALIDSGVEVQGIQAAVDLDAAFEMLLPPSSPGSAEEAGDEDEDEPAEDLGQPSGDLL